MPDPTLGMGNAVTDRTDIDLGDLRARLIAERDDLMQLTAAGHEARLPVELDQTTVGRLSRMDAMQNQAMSIETERRRQVELRRIEAALERMEHGEFGYGVNCGEAIAAKRLELDPTTPVCIDCARSGAT